MIVDEIFKVNQQLADITRLLIKIQSGFADWSNPLRRIDPKGITIMPNRHGGTQEVQRGEWMDG